MSQWEWLCIHTSLLKMLVQIHNEAQREGTKLLTFDLAFLALVQSRSRYDQVRGIYIYQDAHIMIYIYLSAILQTCKQRAVRLLVEVAYNLPDILQVNLLTYLVLNQYALHLTSHLNREFFFKYGACVMNKVMFTNCQISCLHELGALLNRVFPGKIVSFP